MLNIGPLEKVIARLEEGWARYQRESSDTQIRDGLIQRFEFVYELSHKTIKRYLESTSASPEQFDTMQFSDLIRSANEMGLLLGDWSAWRLFREMRNQTSHAYDEDIALRVVEGIPSFIREVVYLRDRLKERLS